MRGCLYPGAYYESKAVSILWRVRVECTSASAVVVFDRLTHSSLVAVVFGSPNWPATPFKGVAADRAGAGGDGSTLSVVEGAPKSSTPTSLGFIAGLLAVCAYGISTGCIMGSVVAGAALCTACVVRAHAFFCSLTYERVVNVSLFDMHSAGDTCAYRRDE
jgi:hypothetical protein